MLILVRHGRTEANATGRLQGRLDLPLDDIGREQVAGAAALVGTPARVISSPLLRARQTAEAFGVPYDVDDRWCELDYGDFEGRSMVDIPRETWTRWRTDPDFRPTGGESMRSLAERVRSACNDLAEEAGERDIVITTHVSPIKAAVAWALGIDITIAWRCHLDQAGICRVLTHGLQPVLLTFNERA